MDPNVRTVASEEKIVNADGSRIGSLQIEIEYDSGPYTTIDEVYKHIKNNYGGTVVRESLRTLAHVFIYYVTSSQALYPSNSVRQYSRILCLLLRAVEFQPIWLEIGWSTLSRLWNHHQRYLSMVKQTNDSQQMKLDRPLLAGAHNPADDLLGQMHDLLRFLYQHRKNPKILNLTKTPATNVYTASVADQISVECLRCLILLDSIMDKHICA